MKLVSIADLAIFNIQSENNIKFSFIKEKWKSLSENQEIKADAVYFSENILYLKTYDTIVNHYIFLNKDKIIKELIKDIDEKFEFEIKDIKII